MVTEEEETRTFAWEISQGSTVVASGHLNGDNAYTVSQADLAVGLYSLEVELDDSKTRNINFAVFAVTMGRILYNSTEHTSALEIGEDYSFEYTLAPSGITLPKLTFWIAHSISGGGSYTAVRKVDLTNVTSGLHTETWQDTQWTAANAGAYANPANGDYGAFCTYPHDDDDHRVSDVKTFTTQLIFRFTVEEEMVQYKTVSGGDAQHASGLRDPRESDFRVRCDFQDGGGNDIILSSTFEYGTVTQTNMDGDSGNEIAEVDIIQTVSETVDPGDYTVTLRNLKDQAGNTGPDPDNDVSVVSDWVIRLR